MNPSSRWENALPRFSLNRRVTVLVLLATCVVVGLVATAGIPLELLPRGFTPSTLFVWVPWQDAPAREVMEKIALPLEEELSTVRGLNQVTSVSGTGFARVFMSFKHGTDMDVAYREVRDRVQRARAQMPDDADRIFIRKDDIAGFPVSMVGLAVDPDLPNSYDLIQNAIVTPIQRIDGVASVDVQGLEEKEVLIELDRDRTEASGLNIYQVAQDLGDDNFTLASGNVRSAGKKLLLRSVARYEDLEAVRNRLVSGSIRVRDIAEVRYEEPEKEYAVRVNSKPAVALNVLKEGDANTIAVTKRVAAAVERLTNDPRLEQIEMTVFFDQGDVVLESLGIMLNSGKVGAIFAIGVLFFFLRRFRMTLIITLSIPLSLLIALTVMFFAGETLNFLTLLALMICVGLLVDNSVVVAENIFRLHREGLSRRDACVRGAGEIALAIVMATLTTVVVFLPAALVEGQMQFFLIRLAMPISVALLASLAVALIFVPLSVYLTLPPASRRKEGEAARWTERAHGRLNQVMRGLYEATFGIVNRIYERVLTYFLRRRVDLLAAVAVVIAITGGAAAARWDQIKFSPQDENERPGFEIDIELPRNYTFEETQAYFLEAEKIVEDNQEALGLEGYFLFHLTNRGELQGWFNNPPTTDLTPREAIEKVLALLPERAGVKTYTGTERQTGDDMKSEYRVVLNGEDPEALEEAAEALGDRMLTIDGVLGIKRFGERQPNELALTVDRELAQKQNINPQVIAGVVGYALRGQPLPEMYRDGREIEVRVRFKEEDRESLDQLASFGVPTNDGSYLPLSALTAVEFTSAAKTIVRRNKRMARSVLFELEEGRENETRERLTAAVASYDLPEGIAIGRGTGGQSNDDVASLQFAVFLSIIFIYLLMGFLFESFILPLSIVLTIPLAMIGVLWGHIMANRSIDFLGMVGIVLLIGVVVNNGIVLIDYANRLRREGFARRDAVVSASSRRFRPIMMTAVTTICGMVPLTIAGTTAIGLSYKSFAFTLIGGLTSATLLTLLVVPVAYTVFDDIRASVSGAVGKAARRGAARGDDALEPAEATAGG